MKKPNLTSLAALALIAAPVAFLAAQDAPSSTSVAPSSDTASAMAKLDPMHQALLKRMDPEGQKLALEMINQTCKGKNSCKGLNSCKSDQNDCAGKGSCKGTTKGPFADKNQAVDLAVKHMAEKRMQTMGN